MVTDEPSVAMELLARGVDVVLVVAGDSGADSAVRNPGQTAGRLAVMVGDTSDAATMAAAREMDAELFNSRQ